MTEIEALMKIVDAINNLTASIGSVSLVLWLMFIFKNMSGHHRD